MAGICGNYYGLIHSFLSDRHQRVVLNGQSSKWSHIKAGVPQGSILGPLLFLVYINDLPEGLTTSAKLFADDYVTLFRKKLLAFIRPLGKIHMGFMTRLVLDYSIDCT